jgi:hypothetical protein
VRRDSFVFYGNFYDSIEQLDRSVQADILLALVRYGLRGEVDPDLKPIANALLMSFKPQIDRNNQKYINGVKGKEHGQKGGRPKNPKETPKKPQENPKETPNDNEDKSGGDSNNIARCNNIPPHPPSEGFPQNDFQKANEPIPNTPVKESINGLVRLLFENHFEERFNERYYWEAKDAGSMTALLKKIQFRSKQKGLSNEPEEVLNELKRFLISIENEWIIRNFTVSIINSKFNEIASNAWINERASQIAETPVSSTRQASEAAETAVAGAWQASEVIETPVAGASTPWEGVWVKIFKENSS